MTGYECEGCQQVYPSYQAMMTCEQADLDDAHIARRPLRTIPRPRVRGYDEDD